jgi:hypothetical protein
VATSFQAKSSPVLAGQESARLRPWYHGSGPALRRQIPITAQSSSSPRAAGCVAKPRKAAMKASSVVSAPPSPRRIEHAVDELRLALSKKAWATSTYSLIAVAGGHVGAGQQFIGAGAQDLQHGLVEPFQLPAIGQLCSKAASISSRRADALSRHRRRRRLRPRHTDRLESISAPSRCWWNSSSSEAQAACPPSQAGRAPGRRRAARRARDLERAVIFQALLRWSGHGRAALRRRPARWRRGRSPSAQPRRAG